MNKAGIVLPLKSHDWLSLLLVTQISVASHGFAVLKHVSLVEEQLLSGWRQSRSVKLKEHTVTWSTLDIYSEAELPLISENNSTSSPSAGECFPAKNRAPGMWDGKAVDGRGRGGDGGGGREEEGRSEWGGGEEGDTHSLLWCPSYSSGVDK